MDPVTHGFVGATSAQLFSDKKSFRAASFVGCIAALAPDLDVFLGSISDPLLQLELHRHFTHSIVFIPFGSLLVSGILWWVVRKKLTFKQTYFFSLAGYATAGFMDVITSYGVHLLWPFLDERFSINIISVFDPLFTVILLGISVFALIKKRKSLTLAAVAWVIFYLSIGFVQKSRVTELAHSKIETDQEIIVKPTLGNQILWSVRYVEDNQLCGMGIRAGFFSEPKIYDGTCAPLVDLQQEYSNFAGTVLYDDIRRFSELSDGLLVRHPEYPNVLGDGRYSMLPTTLSPLWGITADTTIADQHVRFDSYRDASEEVRNAFLDMILGN
ncbi:MAG: metal-dependent hydrolase [Balneolaceae bacterium]|nr:metal-dependent hydrolase [Balneolaceae bacterium]